MAMYTAWNTVRLWMGTKGKNGRLPSLSSQLPQGGGPKRPQSEKQMLAMLHMVSQQLKLPILTKH